MGHNFWGFQVGDRDEGVAIEEGGTCVRARRLLALFVLVWSFSVDSQ